MSISKQFCCAGRIRVKLSQRSDYWVKRLERVVAVVAAFAGIIVPPPAQAQRFVSPLKTAQHHSEPSVMRTMQAHPIPPLIFEQNEGQYEPSVKFLARSTGYTLALTPTGASLSFHPNSDDKGQHSIKPNPHNTQALDTVHIGWTDPQKQATLVGQEELETKFNYFLGNDPSKWHTGIPVFAKVRYRDVAPGIDVVFYGHDRNLEADFVVFPGADLSRLKLEISGDRLLGLNPSGDLTIQCSGSELLLKRPHVYQFSAGKKTTVIGRYEISRNNMVRFVVDRYDKSKELVIDPVIEYSTYFGGSQTDIATGIAVNSAGEAYVTGTTFSTDFPIIQGSLQSQFPTAISNASVAFISKFSADGKSLLYSTFLGDSSHGGSDPAAIKVDSQGNAYIVGDALDGFPIVGGFQSQCNACFGRPDVFLAKLDPTGSQLLYSTYLGGSLTDRAADVAINDLGTAFIVGDTHSGDFPVTAGAFDSICGTDGNCNFDSFAETLTDGFVAKFDTTKVGLQSLVYSTFIGGSDSDAVEGIAIDHSGDAYVTGTTNSADFPLTPAALEKACVSPQGGCFEGSAFVTKIDPTGSVLLFSTFLGGVTFRGSTGSGIVLDSLGNPVVTGTASSGFPVTANSLESLACASSSAPYLAKLSRDGASLIYSTCIGTAANNFGEADAVALDSAGNAYVAGRTGATNFPLLAPVQSQFGGGFSDLFISAISADGSQLLFSTYLGGSANDGSFGAPVKPAAIGLAVDSNGGIYLASATQSVDFLVTPGALKSSILPSQCGGAPCPDAIVTKISRVLATSQTGTITITTNNPDATFTLSNGDGQTFSGSGATFTTNAPAGRYTVTFDPVPGFAPPGTETQSLLAGESISFTGTYKLFPPENLHATVGNASVNLDWSPSPVLNPDGYNIYIEQFTVDHFVQLGTVNAIGAPFLGTSFSVVGQFSDGTISNGILYRFHITVVKGAIESGPSNFILARPEQFALDQPITPPTYPILFLHGITESSSVWDRTKAFLTNTLCWRFGGTLSYSRAVDPAAPQQPLANIAPALQNDVPGSNCPVRGRADFFTENFGSSTADYPPGSVDIGILHQGDEIAGFIRTLKASDINKVNLVAHSMGGLAGRAYIARYLNSPKALNEFVTYGTPHWGVPIEDQIDFFPFIIAFNHEIFDTQGLSDMTVDCADGVLDYTRNPFLDFLRIQRLPPTIRYFVIRGNTFPGVPGNCLSPQNDRVVHADSADLFIPVNAPVDQSPIVSTRQLLTTSIDHFSQTSDFAAILCALEPNCSIYEAHSPVDLEITAPDGRAITNELTEIPGASYMEVPENGGGTSATVIVPFPLNGTYSVKVIPKSSAAPTDTYSLDVTRAGVTTILAQNQPIRAIPVQPYAVSVLAPLTIDIKPGSDPNTVKLGSGGKIPVAILSTPTFNAPAQIDASSLSFGHFGDETSLAFCNSSGEDVNRDGLPDLVCHFFTAQAGFVENDAAGTLKGKTKDGIPFVATDSVRIIP